MKIGDLLSNRTWLIVLVAAVLAGLGWTAWQMRTDAGPGDGFISGNGRIEATEVDVATRLAGRVDSILVDEGALVSAGQLLATMQLDTLTAQRNEANALLQQATTAVAAAQAQIAVREADVHAATAQVAQRDSEIYTAGRHLARSETLAREGMASAQQLDDDRARVRNADAYATAARAQVRAAQSAVAAARAQLDGAQSSVKAAEATLARIEADIEDSQLKAPRAGRVQFRLAQPGEVLAAGGKVLNLVDLTEVYMTFFLPEAVAGRVALGSEVRIVLDAAPQYVIPAQVTFVSATAQFTPRTVETASEREKLMFRVKAQIDRDLLTRYTEHVKTGLPGVAWVRLDPSQAWPPSLASTSPQ